jgi:uncharacterized protein (DUF302 family)
MYGFSIAVRGEFAEVVERVAEALRGEGLGVVTTLDMQSILKAKLGLTRRPYTILGACAPGLAHEAIEAEPEIGLLLPCNVVIREEENGQVMVSFTDPEALLTITGNGRLIELAQRVKAKLERVRDHLASGLVLI